MINFCDFIQVFVFTTNHHLKYRKQGNGLRTIAVYHKVQNLSTCRCKFQIFLSVLQCDMYTGQCKLLHTTQNEISLLFSEAICTN